MLTFDPNIRTRDLSNFLSHPLFIEHQLVYRYDKGNLREESWFPTTISPSTSKILTNWIIEVINRSFRILCLTLTLVNALMGDTIKKRLQGKASAYIIMAADVGGDGVDLSDISEMTVYSVSVDELREYIAETLTQTKGIISYLTPYDLASNYDSMAIAMLTLSRSQRDVDGIQFSNVKELCKITDEMSKISKLGMKNTDDIIKYLKTENK